MLKNERFCVLKTAYTGNVSRLRVNLLRFCGNTHVTSHTHVAYTSQNSVYMLKHCAKISQDLTKINHIFECFTS